MVHRFEARVEPHGKTATFFHVPPTVMEALGPKKRVAVRVTVNDYTYRSTVAPMGGEFLLPLNRQNRTAAGVAAGDVVQVTIERDEEPRVVEVPEDLAQRWPPTRPPVRPSPGSRTATNGNTRSGSARPSAPRPGPDE